MRPHRIQRIYVYVAQYTNSMCVKCISWLIEWGDTNEKNRKICPTESIKEWNLFSNIKIRIDNIVNMHESKG